MILRTRSGHTQVIHDGDEFPIHRLIAVAEYGFDAVVGKDTHHESGVGWDNRPSNIRPIDAADHVALHSTGRDNYASHDRPYRDEDVLRELYVVRDMTVREVADELGCSHPSVVRWLNRHGFETPEPGF